MKIQKFPLLQYANANIDKKYLADMVKAVVYEPHNNFMKAMTKEEEMERKIKS